MRLDEIQSRARLDTVVAKRKIPAPAENQIPLIHSVAIHFTN